VIHRDHNRIVVEGVFSISELLGPLAGIRQALRNGYEEITLDFHACTAAFAPSILALSAQVMKLRTTGVSFELILPNDTELARHFRNTNWAHLLDPGQHPASQFRGFTQVPATHFTNDVEQRNSVYKIIDGILGAIPNLDRRELAALEWSVNEITDNVLVHAQSPIGGLVQLSTFLRAKKRVEYIVADAGLGICRTLRQSHPEVTSDVEALRQAIREGVTRDKEIGQGNGLFGSYQICSQSMGYFHLESGVGKLAFSERMGLRVTTERIPFDGTLVAAQINFSDPNLLAEALKFGGRQHTPMDFVELKYEQEGRDEIIFVMKDEATSFGSRVAGTPVRNWGGPPGCDNRIRHCTPFAANYSTGRTTVAHSERSR
jgi:anti-sigma regulatory factor (Ser/Thr protein kinase)